MAVDYHKKYFVWLGVYGPDYCRGVVTTLDWWPLWIRISLGYNFRWTQISYSWLIMVRYMYIYILSVFAYVFSISTYIYIYTHVYTRVGMAWHAIISHYIWIKPQGNTSFAGQNQLQCGHGRLSGPPGSCGIAQGDRGEAYYTMWGPQTRAKLVYNSIWFVTLLTTNR